MTPPEESILLPTSKLRPGMFVDLELHWTRHPFAFSRFVVRSQKQVETIRELKGDTVRVFPGRSDQPSLVDDPPGGEARVPVPEPEPHAATAPDPPGDPETARNEALHARRLQVKRAYQQKVEKIQRISRDLRLQPANAIAEVDTLVAELAQQFETGDKLLTRLVDLGSSDYSDYNHVANVTMLALMLAASEGYAGEDLKHLATGAVLHDIGKVAIPARLMAKRGHLTPVEVKVLEQHPPMGRKLVEGVRQMPPAVLEIIENHHECQDGSGYPRGLKGEQITPLVRIVAIVNRYDNLCHPMDRSAALAPKEAMAVLYRDYGKRLDRQLIARLVSVLGVYPPGSVVRLSDDRLARVIASRPQNPLDPDVVVYVPDAEGRDPPILQLTECPDLSIAEALRPGRYPSEIDGFFGVAQQIGYMVDTDID